MNAGDTLLRLGITIFLLLAGIGLWILANRWLLWRAKQISHPIKDAGIPTILYFTTPTCAPCKTIQRPALEQVKKLLGDCLKIVEVDASTQQDLASQWGVLSVPTTFILDAQGQPKHINHGPTSAARLLQQLETA